MYLAACGTMGYHPGVQLLAYLARKLSLHAARLNMTALCDSVWALAVLRLKRDNTVLGVLMGVIDTRVLEERIEVLRLGPALKLLWGLLYYRVPTRPSSLVKYLARKVLDSPPHVLDNSPHLLKMLIECKMMLQVHGCEGDAAGA